MLRKTLAYSLCCLVAAPSFGAAPAAWAQAAQPKAGNAAAPGTATTQAMTGVSLDAAQSAEAARLVISWPQGSSLSATATLSQSLLVVRLPHALDVDPAVFAQKAPEFIAAAAISSDRRTLRIALLKPVSLVNGRDGAVQAFDLLTDPTKPPPPVTSGNPLALGGEPAPTLEVAEAPPRAAGPPPRLRNAPAPPGAPRVTIEASGSRDFTRLRLSGVRLPDPVFFRQGDRMAFAMPGTFALDTGSLRADLPRRVRDMVRFSTPTHTSLVMDVEADAVVRHRMDQGDLLIDILPAGTAVDPLEALAAEAAETPPPAAKAAAPTPTAPAGPSDGAPGGAAPAAAPVNLATTLASDAIANLPDPAPSGSVKVQSEARGRDTILTFPFASRAPASVFRRGSAIYALFATKANFDTSAVRPDRSVGMIEPIVGDGASGVRIEIPADLQVSIAAGPSSWSLTFSASRSGTPRPIVLQRERAADGSSRIKAVVPDAVATGRFVDPAAGDDVMVGMALGPPVALATGRSFLEAGLPETMHGLAVIPRADDMDLRRDMDGFVLVRAGGMIMSKFDETTSATGGFTATAPGFIDFAGWRVGPASDFTRNLDKLRVKAAIEGGNGPGEARARLDLARYLLAWELAPEAHGVLRELRSGSPVLANAPEVVALTGAALAMTNRGREALDLLSMPQTIADPASQLWAALAANSAGDPAEARRRFEAGASMLGSFAPQQRALFLMADGEASLHLNDPARTKRQAETARAAATDLMTKAQADLLKARAMLALGSTEPALTALGELEKSPFAPVSARATYEKALVESEKGPEGLAKAIRALDTLRYSWRGDSFEIDLLRTLGNLYIKGGDIRSGLSTLASAATLRPELPEARALRDDLSKQFRHLFLEGGADAMDPLQALALFYDFRQLTPIGPDGDRIVRGLADRLVGLDLLPQAAELLKHQVDNRLQGFAKAHVATDLGAIYVLDREYEKALQAIWGSRSTMLPPALNSYRRVVEAVALAGLERYDHALEVIEFEQGSTIDKVRTEILWKQQNYPAAAEAARRSLPAPGAGLSPADAAVVLRAAVATALASDRDEARNLAAAYGPAMSRSALAEAFSVVTSDAVPSTAQLQAAVATISGVSPFDAVIRGLRSSIAQVAPAEGAVVYNGPTDGNPTGAAVTEAVAAAVPDEMPAAVAAGLAQPRRPAPARPARAQPRQQATREAAPRRPAPAPKQQTDRGVQAPRDPPPMVGR